MLTVPILCRSPAWCPPWNCLLTRARSMDRPTCLRVMVHAFCLLEATGWSEEAPRLWAAVYLHDIARTHDER
jgi:hypothetical protein